MEITTIGIVGYGAFGRLARTLIRRFLPDVDVRIHTRGKRADGKQFFSMQHVARSDVVILAVSIREFEAALKKILPHLWKRTVIVDVATIKVHTSQLLRTLASGHRYIATHPMWGPESYEKRKGDVSGFRIVVAEHTLPSKEYRSFATAMRRVGFDIVQMTPDSHDKHLAETLFLTHFVGQTIVKGGFGRTEIDTVSFGFLMDAVESVRRDFELAADVFTFSPYCADVLERYAEAGRKIRESFRSLGSRPVASIPRIGLSGASGSFSDEATRFYAKQQKIKKFVPSYLISVENVLSALDKGDIDIGIFPIENTTGGYVTEAAHAMAKYNFEIKRIFAIEIQQNLLVKKGISRDVISTITSHEQAIRQSIEYIKREWPRARIVEYDDTAKAAQDLASGKLPTTTAVIASRTAAKLYNLDILEQSIQGLKINRTTFVAAVRP